MATSIRNRSGCSWASRSLSPITTAACSPSARMATCTSAPATAARAATRTATARTRTRCSARSCASTSISGDPYAIPAGNPFAEGDRAGAAGDLGLGLRNPWRFSFDRATGDLWIGDVGQDAYEEVDAEPAGAGGRNYGWNIMEGASLLCRARAATRTALTLPVAEYCARRRLLDHRRLRLSRQRGTQALVGQYVFSDYCTGNLWAIDAAASIGAGPLTPIELGTAPSIRPPSARTRQASCTWSTARVRSSTDCRLTDQGAGEPANPLR